MAKGLVRKSIVVISLVVGVSFWIKSNLEPRVNELKITVTDSGHLDDVLKVAVLSDLHVSDSRKNIEDLEILIAEVVARDPDLVLFLGDFVSSPRFISDMRAHREALLSILNIDAEIPSLFVLGNYESWSDREAWRQSFINHSLLVLENQIVEVETRKGPICIRGLGDAHTGYFQYIDFSKSCESKARLTITHDPAGAFHDEIKGLVFAGHTHCGQVSIPLVGPLWVPSEAPESAWCGLLRLEDRVIYTSAGVGHSILPIRIGTHAEWDMITVEFE